MIEVGCPDNVLRNTSTDALTGGVIRPGSGVGCRLNSVTCMQKSGAVTSSYASVQ